MPKFGAKTTPAKKKQPAKKGTSPNRQGLATKATGYLEGLELELPPHPLDTAGDPMKPRLPADITKISMRDLGLLYGQFVAVAQYADTQLALVDIAHSEAEHEEDIHAAMAGLNSGGSNRDEREWNRKLSPQVKAKARDTLEKRAKKVLLKELIHGYDRAISALSRELSRREWEMDKGRKT